MNTQKYITTKKPLTVVLASNRKKWQLKNGNSNLRQRHHLSAIELMAYSVT